MTLARNSYGKARVRSLRIHRTHARQEVRETTAKVMLQGAFEGAFTHADNSAIIATDSIKNIVQIVAHENQNAAAEDFAAAIASRLLGRYDHVQQVTVDLRETKWTRLVVEGAPHPHSFLLDGNGQGTAAVVATREAVEIRSGVEGFTFMKSTGSGWVGYVRDEYTTLPETTDRVCATSMRAEWLWSTRPADYPAANARLLDTMLRVFATTYSDSVQDSLYRMGLAALETVPEVSRIDMTCPNKHYIPLNLSAFGIKGNDSVLLPTDEPSGEIECSVSRGG
ncbi:factor-independent urate hydroxylase [Lichenicoccus sp.]|uniref:factor-independent urate hydroxylase n=1 Tax=Lichenicoccus sp. TaxID=2781899 RepID=UPI003D0A89AD